MNFLDKETIPVDVTFNFNKTHHYDISVSPELLAFDLQSMTFELKWWIMHELPMQFIKNGMQQTASIDLEVACGRMPARRLKAQVSQKTDADLSEDIINEATECAENILGKVLRDVIFSEEFRNQ